MSYWLKVESRIHERYCMEGKLGWSTTPSLYIIMIFFFMHNDMSNEKVISFYCGRVQTWFLGNIGSHLGDISQVMRKPRLAYLLFGLDLSNPKK